MLYKALSLKKDLLFNILTVKIENSMHVKFYLGETRNFLEQMLRTVNVTDEALTTLAVRGL